MANTVIRIGYISLNINTGGGGAGFEEYASLAVFPPIGEDETIYVALDTNKTYRWSGSTYVEISPSEVISVNGEVGAVILDKSDIGLGDVDNTSDLDKPISTATQTALDDKVSKTGDTMSGILTVEDGLNPINNTQISFGSISLQSDDGVESLTGSLSGSNAIFEKNDGTTVSVAEYASNTAYITIDDGTGPVPFIPTLDEQLTTKKYVDDEISSSISDLDTSLKYNQIVYVDKANTNTYTADGSINKPYKSIEAMYNAITDASASKRYACIIAPGTYTEASTIRIKGWIDLSSVATDTVIVTISGGATLKWSNNSPGRVFIKDIGFTSGLEILNDNPTGTSGLVFDLDNVDAPSLVFRGRGGGRDFIQLRNDTRISGSCTIQSASTTIFDSTNISTLTMNDVGCVAPDAFGSAITASIRSNYIGAISITATTFDVYTDVWGTIIAGNLTIVSNSPSFPCYFNYDATSYPLGSIALSGSNPAQLIATSKSQAIAYTPAVSGDWTVAPDDVKEALDNLAANKVDAAEAAAAAPVQSVAGKVGIVLLDSSDVGLGNVDNTSDADKPISTATQNALDDKEDVINKSTDTSLGTSDTLYPTQNAVKTYVDNTVSSSSPVLSVNGEVGIVVLDSSDIDNQQAVVDYWDVADNSSIKEHLDELAARREAQNTLTKEPTGFATLTESTTSFSDSGPDRTFTITPVSGSFTFYVKGVKFVKSSAESIQIPNTSGNHFIYYSDSGVLSSTQVAGASLFQDNALISIIYWNTDTSTHSYFAEERHGLQMDGATHSYLHTVFGAQYLSGLALQGFVVDGDGSLNTHAQFTADEGVIRDEDLVISILAQTQIPVLFRQGTQWRKKAADSFPLIYSGTAGYTGANGRLPYNQLSGGNWQLTEIANNAFVLVHLFGTNDKETPVIAIQGIATYGNVTAARTAASTEITSLSGLPFAEFVAIGSVVLQSADAFTNTPKATVVSVDGANYVDFRGTQLYTPAGVATSHNLLSGLSGDDHLQYHTDARGDARYNLKSSGDISETSFSITNNQSSASNVVGFTFNNGTVRSFASIASVEIDATSELFEIFTINGIQKTSGWEISVSATGDVSGINFSITSLGQIQYTSDNYSGFVSGSIKFKAFTTSI